MEKITLPKNHNRAVFSAIYLIEELADELENDLIHSHDKIMKKIDGPEEAIDLQHYSSAIRKIRTYIRFMANKYNLQPFYSSYSQLINSKKSKMWEILSDTKSKRLKGFGEFPPKYAQEFDSDIENLLKLTESI